MGSLPHRSNFPRWRQSVAYHVWCAAIVTRSVCSRACALAMQLGTEWSRASGAKRTPAAPRRRLTEWRMRRRHPPPARRSPQSTRLPRRHCTHRQPQHGESPLLRANRFIYTTSKHTQLGPSTAKLYCSKRTTIRREMKPFEKWRRPRSQLCADSDCRTSSGVITLAKVK